MKEPTATQALEAPEALGEETPVLLWDIAIAWEISYNTLYLAGRRKRIPVWRDARGRIYTTQEAAERWYAARTQVAQAQMSADESDPALPIREAAHAVGVSRSTISRGVSRGLIPSQQSVAGIRLVRVSDIQSYIKHAAPPHPWGQASPARQIADGSENGVDDSTGPAQRMERRRVLVSLLRDLGWRVNQQSELLSYDLTQGDYTAIQNRAQHIRQLSDTIEEVRMVMEEWR